MILTSNRWMLIVVIFELLAFGKQSLACWLHQGGSYLGSSGSGVEDRWLAKGVEVKGQGLGGSGVEALVWAKNSFFYKSTVVISPGANITAEAMNGLAISLANTGRIVFVMKYIEKLGTSEGQAGALAELLKKMPEKVSNLDPNLVKVFESSLPISIVGHSMGGSILGDYISKTESPFTHVALYGVSSFTKKPKQVTAKVALFIGSKDGLMIASQDAKAKLHKVESILGVKRIMLENLNHFCIISDSTLGDPKDKKRDLSTNISSEACINEFAYQLDSFLP